MGAIAVQTVAADVLTSAEFCNAHRRVAHLLTMYGFVFFLITTVVMVFAYASPTASTPAGQTRSTDISLAACTSRCA